MSNAQNLARSGMDGAKPAVRRLRGDALTGPGQTPELVEHARLATGAPGAYPVDGEPNTLSPELDLPVVMAASTVMHLPTVVARAVAATDVAG